MPSPSLPCPSQASAGADELVRFGHALQHEGRLGEAAGCYERITRLHPAFADGWFEHGLALQSLGDLPSAVHTFSAGLRLRPASADRLNSHGVMLQTAGRQQEARHAYSRSLARSPADPEAYFNLGTVHEALGSPADALTAYRTSLALDPPDEARVHNNIGGVLSAQGKHEASISAYGEAVEADPGFADGWYNLGNLLLAMSRLGEADVHLRRALRIAPKHEQAARKLQHLQAEQLKPRQAEFETEQQMAALDEAIDICKGDSNCLQELAAEADAQRDADGPLVV
tara:strand:+ start:338 stop:1192 length:855 start_codon:yes stop_codon:yes gene_type:complete